jgi:hypothetical protein
MHRTHDSIEKPLRRHKPTERELEEKIGASHKKRSNDGEDNPYLIHMVATLH